MREGFSFEKGINDETGQELSVRSFEQTSTRGDGTVEKAGRFNKIDIDFGAASHIAIHQEGVIAGSQFNSDLFASPDTLVDFLKNQLPQELEYDQFGRCEITLDLESGENKPVGWSGVKSIEEIQSLDPDISISKEIRMPGGVLGEEQGIQGAWYPEMERNTEGRFVVALDKDGQVKNEKAKFEPLANVATVPADSVDSLLRTNKMTLIIQKDRQTEKPKVLTIFPGENAPAFPAKIDTESYKSNSLESGSLESKFWENHVFLKRA